MNSAFSQTIQTANERVVRNQLEKIIASPLMSKLQDVSVGNTLRGYDFIRKNPRLIRQVTSQFNISEREWSEFVQIVDSNPELISALRNTAKTKKGLQMPLSTFITNYYNDYYRTRSIVDDSTRREQASIPRPSGSSGEVSAMHNRKKTVGEDSPESVINEISEGAQANISQAQSRLDEMMNSTKGKLEAIAQRSARKVTEKSDAAAYASDLS